MLIEKTRDVVNYPNVLVTRDIRDRTIEKRFVVIILVLIFIIKYVSIDSEARVYVHRNF